MAENELDPSIDEQEIPDTPEDVAILYSWANMHGAKYRDFSASRREYRAQMRARAMEAQREEELKAAQEREEAARREEQAARRAAGEGSSSRRAALELEEAAMRAEMERVEAQRHAQAAELARQAAMEAEREAEEARRRSKEQALRYAESEQRRRAFAGPQPTEVPGKIEDPYHYAGHVDPARLASSGIRASGFRTAGGRSQSSSSASAYRPDSLPNPGRLIRDDASRGGDNQVAPPYGARVEDHNAARREHEQEAPAERVSRPENRLFRAPADPRFQSSAARPVYQSHGARSGYRGGQAPDDPNVILPRHEDLREPVPEGLYNRIGQHELAQLEDETHRADEFLAGHHLNRPHDPSVETHTEPRPAYEDQSRKRAREDAEARHHLHDEVARELHHGQREEEAAREAEARRRHERRLREDARLRAEQDARVYAEREKVRTEEQRLAQQEKDRAQAEADEKARAEAARAEEGRAAREREEARREAERRERSKMDLRESLMNSGYRPAAHVSAMRPASGAYAVEGASSRPAWLHSEPPPNAPQAPALNDTLQHSRERVAARWFALKELMGQSSSGEHAKAEIATQSQREVRTPTLCVISMAGGVGKTSMVATLGRTLSAMGEKVLLADTGSHGLLPYYFGARDLRPGVVRTFSPPAGSPDAPVYMVNYDTDAANYDVSAQDHLYSELQRASRGIHRVLLDLNMHSAWMVRRLAKISPAILVPLGPDMNSVLGIQSIERILSGLTNAEGHVLQPFYVLNQFDASLPLHLDVREALRQKLGNRLLPTVIRRAPAVAEALAEGMTVMDYAPNSAVTEDYTQLATWVRNQTAPATTTFRGMRWSEG